MAIERLKFRILDALARDLGPVRVGPMVSRALFDDVSVQLDQMAQRHILRPAREEPLAREGFAIAALYNVSFYNALLVALAEDSGHPLLVGDEELYHSLQEIEADRPAFRALWLPEYRRR